MNNLTNKKQTNQQTAGDTARARELCDMLLRAAKLRESRGQCKRAHALRVAAGKVSGARIGK